MATRVSDLAPGRTAERPPSPPELVPARRYDWERIVLRLLVPNRQRSMKLLALALATFGDLDGTRIRPGLPILCNVTGYSEATIKRHLHALRTQYYLIERVHRGGGNGHQATAASYRLVFPDDLLERHLLLSPGYRREISENVVSLVGR